MSEHTPGPWQLSTYVNDTDRAVIGPDLSIVAMVPWGDSHAEQEANARLIAAAPELLEALEYIAAELELIKHTETEQIWFDKAETAIKKARGERIEA